jgi:hypothetical protein
MATILCIDDELNSLTARKLLLESEGHRVIEAPGWKGLPSSSPPPWCSWHSKLVWTFFEQDDRYKAVPGWGLDSIWTPSGSEESGTLVQAAVP